MTTPERGAASAVTGALQQALAAEHRAAFGYGLLGPRLDAGDVALARQCAAAHESARDAVEASLAAGGSTPVGPQPDYPELYPVAGPGSARRLAVRLEDDTATAWRAVYAAAATAATRSGRTDGAVRATAQQRLTQSALRGTRWRSRLDPARATTPFPGIG